MKNFTDMKRIILLSLAIAIASVSYSQETRNLSSFDEISAAAGIKVILVKGNSEKAVVDVEKGNYDDVVTKVEGDELVVKFKSNMGWGNSKNRKATVTVHYLELEGIEVSSGAHLTAQNSIKSNDLQVKGSSGGFMDIQINADEVEVKVSSGGQVSLKGDADFQKVNVSSGGVMNGYELSCENVDATASSGGVVRVYVTNSFEGSASSGGSISYKGNPKKVDKNAGYSGSIRSKD
jgi:hypothetical protein